MEFQMCELPPESRAVSSRDRGPQTVLPGLVNSASEARLPKDLKTKKERQIWSAKSLKIPKDVLE